MQCKPAGNVEGYVGSGYSVVPPASTANCSLGIDIGESSVSKYMVRCRKPPSQTWRTFLENHAKQLVSIDFFTLPTFHFQVLYVFLVLPHDRRRILHFHVTAHPTAEWTGQQLREAFPFEQLLRYLLRDPDSIFGHDFREQVLDMGIREVLSAPRSPWQRAYVERVMGSIQQAVARISPGVHLNRATRTSHTPAILVRMKNHVHAIVALAVLALAPSPAGSDARARELILTLHLEVLPGESGYLGIIGDSAQKAQFDGRALKIQSQVYYMLTRERPINYLHWLASDDTHILIEGGPVDYFIFHPDGHAEKLVLGRDVAIGQRPVIAVPGGCWKALRLHPGASYALMANALSPEFTPDRVKIGAGDDWLNRYAASAPWATKENLRALIGPNWKP